MKCSNCSIGEYIPLPHKKYILLEFNPTTGPTKGGVPVDGMMCNKCGFLGLFHKFKPNN